MATVGDIERRYSNEFRNMADKIETVQQYERVLDELFSGEINRGRVEAATAFTSVLCEGKDESFKTAVRAALRERVRARGHHPNLLGLTILSAAVVAFCLWS